MYKIKTKFASELIQQIDIIQNECSVLDSYPLISCLYCSKLSHISHHISNKGLCNCCSDNLYKKYDYDYSILEDHLPVFNEDLYKCQGCKMIDQSVPGGPLYFTKIGDLHYNYCLVCSKSITEMIN